MNHCKAQCCRKGKLLLQNEEEVNLITGDKKKELLKNKLLERQVSGNYHFDFKKGPCRHLDKKTNMCSVYKNPQRPIICHDYPLFKMGDYIITAGNCPAVAAGKFDKHMKQCKELGFKII